MTDISIGILKISDRFSPSPSLHQKRGEVQACSVRLRHVSSEETTFWFGDTQRACNASQMLDLVQLQTTSCYSEN